MVAVSKSGRRSMALLLALTVLLGTVPGVAAAETKTGGTVVVGPDEEVSDLTAYGGSVVVRGTVEGDLTAFAGNVVIESGAEVTGQVSATAGNVQIDGTVQENVTATGGSVSIGPTARIGGTLEAAAGSIVVAGSVGQSARLAGGSITLTPTASIDGDVEYAIGEDGSFDRTTATINGTPKRNEDLSVGGDFDFDGFDVSGTPFGIYGFFVNLLVGGLLVLLLPRTSDRVAAAVGDSPLRTAGIGLLALVGIPILLVIVAVTIVGIPVSIAGLVAYLLAVWIATVYGRYAVGDWLLEYTDVDNRWASLAVGLVVVAIFVRIPFLGELVQFIVLLLGLGAMATLSYQFIEVQRGSGESAPVESAEPA